jgi:hypothetical protein
MSQKPLTEKIYNFKFDAIRLLSEAEKYIKKLEAKIEKLEENKKFQQNQISNLLNQLKNKNDNKQDLS